MGGDALAHDRHDGEAGGEDVDRRQQVDARVRIEEDRGLEVAQRGLKHESLVVIRGRAVVVSGRPQTPQIIDRHRAGGRVADGTNGQVGEVGRIVRQNDPGSARRIGAEQPRASAIRRVNRERAEADRHAPHTGRAMPNAAHRPS